MNQRTFAVRLVSCTALAVSCLSAAGCGDRPAIWSEGATTAVTSYGLTGSVIVVDDAAHRAVVVKTRAGQEADRSSIPLGHNVVHAETSEDKTRLFVLTAGDTPRHTADDQLPALTVIEGGVGATTVRTYPLTSPLSGLAVDPLGRWAVVYAAGDSTRAFVQNPNLLLVVDLEHERSATNPVARTLRSFGGAPQRLTFSKPLSLAGGARRLLVVESQQDLSLLDLDHVADTPARPDITVPLTSGSGARVLKPAGVVVDDGDAARTDDARIGVRLANDSNVLTINLAAVTPTAEAPNDFLPKLNLTDVGGAPSDIAFVRTDGGLRLAALVPSTSKAVLIDPDTSITTDVALPRPYARVGLVTSSVNGAGAGASEVSAPSDVALLWSGTSGGVALWTLGTTAGAPYRSVEVLGVESAIGAVTDIPRGNPALKLLSGSGVNAFYVLNLRNRTVAPLTTSSTVSLSLAPSGERVWAYRSGATDLASIDLSTLSPVPVVAELPIASAFEIQNTDSGRSVVALHTLGGVGATIFDALAPDTATARSYAGLLLEGL